MLDLPELPLLDKTRLIGGCMRLPLKIDAARLRAEIEALPTELWGTRGGRVGVHRTAEAIFLRGYAPAEGDKPIEDRPPLDLLPYAREVIERRLGAQPLRCLLARLPPGVVVGLHVDRPPYFGKSLRVHFPVVTNDDAWMYCCGLSYRMRSGEVWVLNNSGMHGVWNASADGARTHMICDFIPSPALLDLMSRGERHLGIEEPAVQQRLAAASEAR
jgi:Aspartyl/Asparaginyl beta-hydroxylase